MVSDEKLAELRASLEQERAQLQRQIGEMHRDPGFDENFADSGAVAAEQGEHRTIVASLEDQLVEVEAALARMDDGRYGRCEAGGEEIPEARLEAFPATRFCINHA
ncbi:MAG: TraR/DksA C4-type zinc finger protein [Actinobacteria bacterium]|nr:TraR/DksA C4-type zinc finger protein [Actinomycetota bacterium]